MIATKALSCEAGTQTDYTLSDIERLEDLKVSLFDQKQRADLIIREATSYKEIKKKINELFSEEIRLKPMS